MTENFIGIRIKTLRKEKGISQEDMAKLLGFNDRQTVSAIETGKRRVTASELLLASEKLKVSINQLTDPFQLDGKERFSWRQTGVNRHEIKNYEQIVGRLISAYRIFRLQVGQQPEIMRWSLKLSKDSGLEEASDSGERFVVDFKLGNEPAKILVSIMEEQLGILVLMVDNCSGISGAACRLPDLDTVLINRNEVVGRRNFDLAHELFHILTWEQIPPNHLENKQRMKNNRVEKLADNFAAAVLMPKKSVELFGNWKKLDQQELITQLNGAADELMVTSTALMWRLVNLNYLTKVRAKEISKSALKNNGRAGANVPKPKLFSKDFATVVSQAINQGYVSARRSAELLGVDIEDMVKLFSTYDLECDIEL